MNDPDPVELELPGGETLRGDFRPHGPMAVVYVHGFGSHRGGEKAAALAEESARRGWAYAAFDFRGHGSSVGLTRDLTASRLLADLSAVQTFLAERGSPRIGLVGSSMGGFAAAWFAVGRPETVAGCVLLAPAFRFLERRWEELTEPDRREWARTGVRRLRNEWVDVEIGYPLVAERADFDPADLARRWQTPLLIYHGMADDTVPASDSVAFAEAAGYPDIELRLLKDGDHRLTAYKDEIAAAAGEFFERNCTDRG
jgi:uncharacterized protein